MEAESPLARRLNSMQQKWGRLDMMQFVELTSQLIHTYLVHYLRDNNVHSFCYLQPKLVVHYVLRAD